MNTRYCPDCQAECAPNLNECPECQFPLRLEVHAQGDRRSIPASERNSWQRIVTILNRNGIRIETKNKPDPLTHSGWWALPVVGFLMLLASVLVGPMLVDSIWPAQTAVAAAPVLDLSDADPVLEDGDGTVEQEDPAVSEGANFLAEALRATDNQKRLTDELQYEDSDVIVKQPLSREEIENRLRQALMRLRVDDRYGRGALIRNDGLFLTQRSHLRGAFDVVVRNVNENGNLVKRGFQIVPEAALAGEEFKAVEQIDEDTVTEMSLLKIPTNYDLDFVTDYDVDLKTGEKVHLARFVNGKHYFEDAEVVDVHTASSGVEYWQLNISLTNRDVGGPVFNDYGELAGVTLNYNNRTLVLSMLRLREKAPRMFKQIR